MAQNSIRDHHPISAKIEMETTAGHISTFNRALNVSKIFPFYQDGCLKPASSLHQHENPMIFP